MLQVSGLDQFIDVVVCHDMVGRGKPDPEMAQLAAAKLGLTAQSCVVVGDLPELAVAMSTG